MIFKPNLNKNIILRKEIWGGIVFNKVTKSFELLNNDAIRLLQKCNGRKSIEKIAFEISQEFNTPIEVIKVKIEKSIYSILQPLNIIDIKTIPKEKRTSRKNEKSNLIIKENDIISLSRIEKYVSDKILSAPISVSFELTSKCNLSCIHCYANSKKLDDEIEELSMEEIFAFINELAAMRVFVIILSGGEPLCREDIFPILKHCTKNSIVTSLSTNGTLLTSEKLEKLIESGLSTIQISIDGLNEISHEKLRRVRGSYHKAMQGLKMALKSDIEIVCVASCINKFNYKEIPHLIDKLAELGVSVHRLLRFIPIGRGDSSSKIKISTDEIKRLYEIVQEKVVQYQGKMRIVFSEAFNPPIINRPSHICIGGITWCAVNPKGYVVPCTYLNGIETATEIGSNTIREKSFSWIWRKSPLFQNLRKIQSKVKGKCRYCEYLSSCKGGCRAAAYSRNKDIFDYDPNCQYMPQSIQNTTMET